MTQVNRKSKIEDRQSAAPLPFTFRPPGPVDGRYVGRHRSVKRGRSQTFEDHRPYLPGDDVRDVDWKLYARSDKLYVKRYQMHAQLSVHLVLDASASMGYAGRGRGKVAHAEATGVQRSPAGSKWAAAKAAAIGLSQVVLGQQDRVGLAVATPGGSALVAARAGMDQASSLSRALKPVVPAGEAGAEAVLPALAAQHRRAVAVVFSDLMQPKAPLLQALAAWRARGGEALVMQVLHPDELALPEGWGPGEAVDPESGRAVSFDAADVGAAFQQRSAEWVDTWRRALVGSGVDHRVLVCGQSWVDAMRHWLSPL